jgi:hypothetical protein
MQAQHAIGESYLAMDVTDFQPVRPEDLAPAPEEAIAQIHHRAETVTHVLDEILHHLPNRNRSGISDSYESSIDSVTTTTGTAAAHPVRR